MHVDVHVYHSIMDIICSIYEQSTSLCSWPLQFATNQYILSLDYANFIQLLFGVAVTNSLATGSIM